ncbi:HAD family hydrolase [Kitasatospora sp. CM 4170]|uniref:HAD family hydrolase n=1 Tax=Kitasatospora aburaviensis TaxID=67265 RepID=A0ABW1F9X5_9ACTN|nr:HAD family hydrolase [Kitasatospora sp. CM 4170]WNM43348.1 HAD family hydrolase [Kitasatospora sp. CM 4170]
MATAQYQPSTAATRPADDVGGATELRGTEDHEARPDTDRASVLLTDSQPLRVGAWQDTPDAYLAQYAHVTGRPQRHLDAMSDLPAHLTGRLDADTAAALLAECPVITDLAAQHLGPSGDDLLRLLVRHQDRRFEELLRSRGVSPRKGAVSLLLALRTAGIRTAAVSTSRRGTLLLRGAGLADLVDVCVDAGDAGHYGLAGPPDPGLYELALRLLQTAPARSALLAGTPLGTAAGVRAGFGRTAAITFDHGSPSAPWPAEGPLVRGLDAVAVVDSG